MEDERNYLAGQFVSILSPGLTHVRPLSGDTRKTSVWAFLKSGEDSSAHLDGTGSSVCPSSEAHLGKLSVGVLPRLS